MSDTSLVARWYNQNASFEHNRLVERPLEREVTMRVILDGIAHFSDNGALKIADIGGGTGRYGTLGPFSTLLG